MSFIKNSPSADKTGKPPAEASPTPGVVTMKLSVVTKNSEANYAAHHGSLREPRLDRQQCCNNQFY